jgi:hypothetical protein
MVIWFGRAGAITTVVPDAGSAAAVAGAALPSGTGRPSIRATTASTSFCSAGISTIGAGTLSSTSPSDVSPSSTRRIPASNIEIMPARLDISTSSTRPARRAIAVRSSSFTSSTSVTTIRPR